jgi:2-polyprenyl-6-methoxyphenol hydroxylase-like FAD-dependent oxidoreductase
VEASTTVVIAGGGPVGLVLALLLDRLGVDSIVLERSASTERVPKARGYNQRTMEIFRQLGIADQVRPPLPRTEEMVFVDSLLGHEYTRTNPEPDRGQTPSWKCIRAQDLVEEAIFGALEKASRVQVAFSTEYQSFVESQDGVVVSARSTASGLVERIAARWLIGADGANSLVRDQLNIELIGTETLLYALSQRWRSPLLPDDLGREIGGYFVVSDNPVLGPLTPVANDYSDGRFLSLFTVPERERGGPGVEDDLVLAKIRAQIGREDAPVDLLERSTYRISDQVAAHYRRGAVFLAGDAAHRFPPTGIGINTGLQDAHNLAWKLAYVFHGYASSALLGTYESERRPVAQANADWSTANARRMHAALAARRVPPVVEAIRSGDLDRIAFAVQEQEYHTHWAGQALGFTYEIGCVVPDGSMAEAHNSRTYVPADRPGGRFPHLWLDDACTTSTLDWFDREFVVVCGPKATAWYEAAVHLAAESAVPIGVQTIPRTPRERGFRMGEHGAVVVRPDGHVAWRMPGSSADPLADLRGALDKLLS